MIYLDHQATTPLAPAARAAMLPWLGEKFANPHSPHRPGREAAAAIEVARGQVLAALLYRPDVGVPDGDVSQEDVPQEEVGAREAPPHPGSGTRDGAGLAAPAVFPPAMPGDGRLIFTGGATEAANWAIKGTFQRRPAGRDRIVVTATDHACVLDSARSLGGQGAEIVVLPVDRDGLVDMAAATAAIDARTALVTTTLVNNEIGVVQPVGRIAGMARRAGAVMFCDAAQALGRVPIPVGGCDLVALSAHKAYGPKGVGALWVRAGREPEPLLHGGGQESGLRSGTLSPALCVGFGVAAGLAIACAGQDRDHAYALHRRLRDALGPGWRVNGSQVDRWPGNLNLRRDGVDAARLISELRGIAFSAGSACASGSGRPSHVLKAIGLSDAQARSSIRLGFGRDTTEDEVDRAAAMISEAVARQLMWAA